ncbi:MAG TPA: hypothetical protein VKB79_04685 [Bryobacteraceae bacterium]|nr:hypothetical protein [Bryobacteraceae bacterium]
MRSFLLLSALFVATSASNLPAQTPRLSPRIGGLTTFYNQFIPLLTIGDGWSQKFVLQNVDGSAPALGFIKFYDQTGAPLAVNIKGLGLTTAVPISIVAGNSMVVETVLSSAPLQIGWASVALSSGGTGDLFGQTLYRKQYPGLPDFMCSLPFGAEGFEKTTTYFDNTNGNITGMGILAAQSCDSSPYACKSSVPLQVTVRDISGTIISQKTISQMPGSLRWMNLATDFPETAGRVGTFEVAVVNAYSVTLNSVSIQFAGNGAFTMVAPFES